MFVCLINRDSDNSTDIHESYLLNVILAKTFLLGVLVFSHVYYPGRIVMVSLLNYF